MLYILTVFPLSLLQSTLVGALVQRHKVNIKSILVLAMTDAQAALIRDTVPQGFAVSTVMDSIGI